MGMDPKVSVGKNLPAAESPELDPRVSVGNNLPAANSPDPDLRVESRVEDLEEPCSRKNKRLRTLCNCSEGYASVYQIGDKDCRVLQPSTSLIYIYKEGAINEKGESGSYLSVI